MIPKHLLNISWSRYSTHLFNRQICALRYQETNLPLGLRFFPDMQKRNCGVSSYVHNYTQNENTFMFQIVNKGPLACKALPVNLPPLDLPIIDEATFTSYLNKDWRSSTATDITQAFIALKPYCIQNEINIADSRFDKLVDGLMDHCEKLKDQELYNLLKCLSEYPQTPTFKCHNYHDVWSCLDDMCCWKMRNWDVDTMFVFGDIFFQLRLGKLADFIFEILDRLVKKADQLTKDQLVRIFFYFNVCRKRQVDYEYEYALQFKSGEMNVDEKAVVALGFFKTETKIKSSHIISDLIQEVGNSAMGIHEMALSAILKALRFSTPIHHVDEVNKMLDQLCPELERFSELACLHVALLATGIQTFHPNILRKCSQKLAENLPNLRIKEIERTLNVLTMFTFDPKTTPDIFDLAFDELHEDSRIGEMNQYPKCLPAALHYFSLRGRYSYTLMDRILAPDFIAEIYGKAAKFLPFQILSLDCSIDIECPDYKGNRLGSIARHKASKWLTYWAPSRDQWKKLTAKDKLFLDIKETLIEIIKSEDLLWIDHILPHFATADLVVCKQNGTFVSPASLKQYTLGDIMRPDLTDGKKWYAVLVLSWNNVIRNTTTPLGQTAMKFRQLEKLGYTIVPIFYHEFITLMPEDKMKYILKKLI